MQSAGSNQANFSSTDVDKYFDSLYARQLLNMNNTGFDSQLITDLTTLINEYRYTIGNYNATIVSAAMTPFFNQVT